MLLKNLLLGENNPLQREIRFAGHRLANLRIIYVDNEVLISLDCAYRTVHEGLIKHAGPHMRR